MNSGSNWFLVALPRAARLAVHVVGVCSFSTLAAEFAGLKARASIRGSSCATLSTVATLAAWSVLLVLISVGLRLLQTAVSWLTSNSVHTPHPKRFQVTPTSRYLDR